MAMDLTKQTFSTAPEYFIAGTAIGITTAVKEAAEDLEAHVPVVLSDGKAKAAASGATDGLYGITADSTESGGDAVIYLTGEFFADALTLPDGLTADDLEPDFRNIGIFLK